jgi:hypothetical protein
LVNYSQSVCHTGGKHEIFGTCVTEYYN